MDVFFHFHTFILNQSVPLFYDQHASLQSPTFRTAITKFPLNNDKPIGYRQKNTACLWKFNRKQTVSVLCRKEYYSSSPKSLNVRGAGTLGSGLRFSSCCRATSMALFSCWSSPCCSFIGSLSIRISGSTP